MYNKLITSPEPVIVPIEKPNIPNKPKENPNIPNPFIVPKPIIKPGVEPIPKA